MNTSGACLAWSSVRTNGLMVKSCWNGRFTNLNVPSIYQLLALLRCSSCWSVAKMMWRFPCFFMSAFRKASGRWSWHSSNSKSSGSRGHVFCRTLLAVLARWSGLESAGHGSSPISLSMTWRNIQERKMYVTSYKPELCKCFKNLIWEHPLTNCAIKIVVKIYTSIRKLSLSSHH